MRLEMETDRFYLGRDYSEALEDFGAIPFHISLIPNEEYIAGALENLDGILLPGSDTDVDPLIFRRRTASESEKNHSRKGRNGFFSFRGSGKIENSGFGNLFRDAGFKRFARRNVFQDIEAQIPNAFKHEQGIPLERNSHTIEIENESLIGESS